MNPKVYYLVCRNIAFGETLDKDDQRNKDIFYGRVLPDKDYEKNIIIVKEALLDKKYSFITTKDLKAVYYKISGIEILDKELISIIRIINSPIEDIYEKMYVIIKEIVMKNFFAEYMELMAKFIMNLVLRQEQCDLIIPYPNPFKLIMENVTDDEYSDYIKKLLERLDMRTKANSYKHDISENRKTLEMIKNISSDIKTRFLINEIYVYGSLVRGDDNEYSDLDLLLIVDKANILKIEIDKLFEYLYYYIKIHIDLKLLVHEEMDKQLTIDMKRNLTRIDV